MGVQVIRPVGAARPLIQVTVDLDTLRGLAEHPADLTGYGPITADTARALATDGIWRRLITDPLTGTLLEHGTHRYHPPAAIADHVRARDHTCRFPGCTRPATRCELDHLIPFPRGTTSTDNLHPLCTRHHHLKHDSDWQVRTIPGGLEWTSPGGRTHRVHTHDHRPEPTIPARSATPSTVTTETLVGTAALTGPAPVAEEDDDPPF